MEVVDEIFAELHKFSSDVAEFGESVDPAAVRAFEAATDVRLPADYLLALKQSNGFGIMGDEVYGIAGKDASSSLETVYYREHHDVQYPQPSYLVPFSSDGGGNFYCFDTRYKTENGFSCPVVFWVSNYLYTEDDAPEIVYNSFSSFVNEVIIGWTLKAFDYEGNER